eukprot:9359776-Karenia_brevis.AAC.1
MKICMRYVGMHVRNMLLQSQSDIDARDTLLATISRNNILSGEIKQAQNDLSKTHLFRRARRRQAHLTGLAKLWAGINRSKNITAISVPNDDLHDANCANSDVILEDSADILWAHKSQWEPVHSYKPICNDSMQHLLGFASGPAKKWDWSKMQPPTRNTFLHVARKSRRSKWGPD